MQQQDGKQAQPQSEKTIVNGLASETPGQERSAPRGGSPGEEGPCDDHGAAGEPPQRLIGKRPPTRRAESHRGRCRWLPSGGVAGSAEVSPGPRWTTRRGTLRRAIPSAIQSAAIAASRYRIMVRASASSSSRLKDRGHGEDALGPPYRCLTSRPPSAWSSFSSLKTARFGGRHW